MRRLILFDIDGTLLSTRGAARRAFHHAMLEVYGTAGPIATHPFDGKTDPQIARELLAFEGRSDAETDAGLPLLWEAYIRELEIELSQSDHETDIMPGVCVLLSALEREADALVGLVTGNIERGAALKVSSAGLSGFRLGAFGSDCEQREGLPPIAVERARALYGIAFRGQDILVIGDTPADVRCGQALGVHAVAVATGQHPPDQLRAAGAHTVFEDLSDTEQVLRVLLG
jgi:phosphoglycolate phosphatase-like HAD superfamily hydrolase